MSVATGQIIRVRAADRSFEARVLLVGDARDVVLDVEGAGGVHRFTVVAGKRWRAADESRWPHGDVDIVPIAAASAPAPKVASGRRRAGW